MLGLVFLLLTGACQNGAGRPGANARGDSAAIDTTNRDPLDGLSREQIERAARPMTPEQAKEMGIIDTTIKVEDQAPRDPMLETAPPASPPR